MTLGGLVKHMAGVEERMLALAVTGERPAPPWDAIVPGDEPDFEWRTAGDDTPEGLYALWRSAVERSKVATAAALADLHDEYARHVGHADLVREAVDGLVGEDPPQP